jgi:hypothetical protein
MERALEEVKKVEGVDTANIAVIGYCFGKESFGGLDTAL